MNDIANDPPAPRERGHQAARDKARVTSPTSPINLLSPEPYALSAKLLLPPSFYGSPVGPKTRLFAPNSEGL